MKKFLSIAVLYSLIISLFTSIAIAHPGRIDSNGGHTNRKTGEYHYHNGGGSSGGNGSTSNKRQNADVVDIKKVQERLNELGYDCGTPDGVKGEKTVAAIKAFQKDKGLEPDGVVGPKTKEALGL